MLSVSKTISPSTVFDAALDDLRRIIVCRMQSHFNKSAFDLHRWIAENCDGALSKDPIVLRLSTTLNDDEWIVLMLALVPHLQPDFFSSIIAEQMPAGGDFPEFGGVKGINHRGLLPTGETAQFVLAGNNITARLAVQQLFREEHFFYRNMLLWLEPVKEGEPAMSGRIMVAQDWLDKLLYNKETVPRFGVDFPAKRITTNMLWDDLVLNQQTKAEVNEIADWLAHRHRFEEDENLQRKIKPGFRVLFYGSSGTGKTLTATLLGRRFGKEVYRVDLSQVVSKYIGETEKNLENVFRKAETKNWILFFDEADALFGKRTNVQSAHDKYANQEVSYLLQRVEDYAGLLILASNFKNNLDEAFLRRFALIHFPMPNAADRALLWSKSMPARLKHDTSVNIRELAQYELSGGSIINAIQYAALRSYVKGDGILLQADLVRGVQREYIKEDKSF
jgi:hypothetical protein